jgi:hypothetical protein
MSKNKCFANRHMTPEEYALWDVSRQISHHTGTLYFDGRAMAARFADTKKDCIYRIARALVTKGWYEVISPRTRNKRTGLYAPAQYRVLSAEEWAKNHPHECLMPSESSLEIQTGNQSGKQDRHQSGNPEPPVWKSRTSCLEIQTYSDKENIDKEIVRESKAGQPPSLPVQVEAKEKTESDYRWISVQMAKNAWPVTRQTEQIVRDYLKQGQSKEGIAKAIEATMDSVPKGERQPGLYLAQNLKGNMDLLIAKSRGEVSARRNDDYPRILDDDRRSPTAPNEAADAERRARLESILKAHTGAVANA